MNRFVLAFLLLFSLVGRSSSVYAQEAEASPFENSPREVEKAFENNPLSKSHEFSFHLNPYYLHGDFDGDGKLDTAVLVKEKKTGKIGILIFHSGTRKFFLLGAGVNNWNIWTNENGGDNFDSVNFWFVARKGPVQRGDFAERTPKLKGDALKVGRMGVGDYLIYWDGRKYCHYTQSE